MNSFVFNYSNDIANALQNIPDKTWRDALNLIKFHRTKGRIYVAGNGGSAAISEHLTCDFSKGCDVTGVQPLRVFSLSSNMPLLTAISNDISYEESFSKQLKYNGITDSDVLILISSSGNSSNIIHAANYGAKCIGAKLIGLTGFTGGKLKDMSDVSFHIPIENYGIVEDCHQAIMHCLAQMHLKEAKEWF